MCRSLLLFCLLGLAAAEDTPQQSLAKLMKLGYGLAEKAKKGIDQHAFGTGEMIGKRLRADQRQRGHSVETKIEAAREGLQDSIQSGVSLLEEGVGEARAVAETPEVGEAVKSVQAAVAKNAESKTLVEQSDAMLQKASDFVKGSLDATLKNIPGDAEPKKILDTFQEAFAAGEEEEAKRLKDVNDGFLKKDGTTSVDQVVKAHLDVLQSKANRFIESAGKAAFVGLDKAPEMAKEAENAAKL